MRLTIPDTTADPYVAIAERQGRPVDAVITAQLDRFAHCPPGERTVAISLADADAALGGTPVLDGPDLLRRIENLAGITFHRVKLDFTAGQLEELARRAAREGKTVEDLAKDIIEQMARSFFWGTP